jgi:hypothetical protein
MLDTYTRAENIMEQVSAGASRVTPASLSDYLKDHSPVARAQVQTGAWNVGSTTGMDFRQWAGPEGQRQAGEVIHALSHQYWELCRASEGMDTSAVASLAVARDLILEAETSCFLFWGDAWLPQLHARTESARQALEQAELSMKKQLGGAGGGSHA